MEKKNKVIVISAQKGGVGKTLTAKNLAYELAVLGNKVLMIDGDPQNNLTDGMAPEQHAYSIAHMFQTREDIMQCVYSTRFKNLNIIPGERLLEQIEMEPGVFSHNIDRLKVDYDYMIIDTSPYFNRFIAQLPKNALFIIPALIDSDSLNGANNTIGEYASLYGTDFTYRILFSKVDHLKTTMQDLLELKKLFKGVCFQTYIHENRFAPKRSRIYCAPLSERYARQQISKDFKSLAQELEEEQL